MTQSPTESDWSARFSLGVAREIRRHRLAQGLSAQQLSDRCAMLGVPIQRSVLANLESGRRSSVTVAEVVVLAYALGVPPGILLFPVGYEKESEVLPRREIEPVYALGWFAGELVFDQESAGRLEDSALVTVREHQKAVVSLQSISASVKNAKAAFMEVTDRQGSIARDYEAKMQEFDELSVWLRDHHGGYESPHEEEYFAKSARLTEIAREVEALREGAHEYRYAQQRAERLEATQRSWEDRVTAIRSRLRAGGYELPLLPRDVSYLDPGAGILEDKPAAAKIDWTQDLGIVPHLTSQSPQPIEPESETPLLASPDMLSDEITKKIRELAPELVKQVALLLLDGLAEK